VKPSWTAHNIKISDSEFTIGAHLPAITQDPIYLKTKEVIEYFYPNRQERKDKRLIDLACLEGGYSVEFARLGFDVTGLEVRETNLQACNYVQERIKLENLRFVRDDVRNLENYGRFEIVFCCGIFYHVDNPFRFLQSISNTTSKLLILNTHFSSETENSTYNLGDLEMHEGFEGRWYPEYDTSQLDQREIHRWASWDNNSSFWPTKFSLLEMLSICGFKIVFEQYMKNLNPNNDLHGGMPLYDRAQFVCLKS
jgi:hypothetical protein